MQPVVRQGTCGCCWAFAAVAQLESLYRRMTMNPKCSFSAQYLVDCSTVSPNNGCFGGWPRVAMEHIIAHGIPTSSSYRFTGVQDTCESTTPFIKRNTFQNAVEYNLNGREDLLMNLLAKEGPVVVVMYVSRLFMKYDFGIFYDSTENCPVGCTNVNHAMLLVGYGTDVHTGIPFWLLRNSWGINWGEKGYVRMLRDGSNNCNVACYAMFIKA